MAARAAEDQYGAFDAEVKKRTSNTVFYLTCVIGINSN